MNNNKKMKRKKLTVCEQYSSAKNMPQLYNSEVFMLNLKNSEII